MGHKRVQNEDDVDEQGEGYTGRNPPTWLGQWIPSRSQCIPSWIVRQQSRWRSKPPGLRFQFELTRLKHERGVEGLRRSRLTVLQERWRSSRPSVALDWTQQQVQVPPRCRNSSVYCVA